MYDLKDSHNQSNSAKQPGAIITSNSSATLHTQYWTTRQETYLNTATSSNTQNTRTLGANHSAKRFDGWQLSLRPSLSSPSRRYPKHDAKTSHTDK